MLRARIGCKDIKGNSPASILDTCSSCASPSCSSPSAVLRCSDSAWPLSHVCPLSNSRRLLPRSRSSHVETKRVVVSSWRRRFLQGSADASWSSSGRTRSRPCSRRGAGSLLENLFLHGRIEVSHHPSSSIFEPLAHFRHTSPCFQPYIALRVGERRNKNFLKLVELLLHITPCPRLQDDEDAAKALRFHAGCPRLRALQKLGYQPAAVRVRKD
mmetsp:Transcript_23053/g.51868  ORF Transcript_23053/g.51868 Transcript_23053/m.51868 type:complete len:214 (+) Transcript_23053:171-812(+)